MKYLKKTLSLLLCLVMVVGLLPMTAFAVEYTFTVSADPVEGGTVYIDEPGVTQVPADGSSYRAYAVANEGYKFIGWHNEHGTFLTNQKSCPFYPGDDSDMERIAKFEKIVTYTVTFDSDGGSAVTAQNVESGQTATEPTAPTKEGYTFKGWTYKGSPYNFSKPVAENITLYARWGTEYNITAIPTPISGQSISSDDLDSYFPSSSSYTYKNSTPYWDWYDPGVPSGVAVAGTNYYAYAIMYLEDYSAVPYEGDFVVKYAGTELSKISSTDIYKDNMKSGYRIYMYDTYNVALQVRVYLGTPTGAGNTYNIISGANGIYQKGSTADKLSFTADGNIADFIGVEVDGYLINVSDYNVESGSTIVELKKAYLESLSAGEHPLKIRYHDGEASTKFTVKDAAPTTYTVTFDSDGGSAVTAQTVESGKTATKPADPTREGYTFKGWTLDGAAYDFATPITGNITLKAKWEEKQTATVIDEIHIGGITMPVVGAIPINSATTSTPGVTIGSDTFWVRYVPETNDLKDLYDDSTHVDSTPFRSGIKYSLQVMLEPQNSCTIAADAKIFYNGVQLPAPDASDLSKSCAIVVPDGTRAMALISGEASVPTTYAVTFDSDGGSAVTAQTVESGKTATKPADPTREGYTFKGWTLDGAAYDFATPVTGNITLKAKWEAAAPIEYAIEVTLNGYSLGAKVADAYVSESSDTVDFYDFNEEGTFFCIFEDDGTGQSDWGSTVTQFEADKDYWLVVALAKPGGDALPETELDADNATLVNGCVDKFTVYDDDLWWVEFKLSRLSEALPDVYTITFDAAGGSVTPGSATTGNDGKLTSLPTPTHTNPSMAFDGWYTGKTGDIKVTTDTVFTSNTTVYAHWNVDYAIEVTLNGYELGKKVVDTTLTENSDNLDIDRENCHIFTEEDGEPDWSSTVTEFEANKDYWLVIALTKQGGDALTSADLGADDVDLTNDYTKEQLVYDDDLWWVSYKLKRLDTSVPTIYAVTFDSDGGSAVTAQTVESGKPATKPADPTKEGYTFKGWHLGETAYDFATPVTGDITLKAKWEKIETPTDPADPSKPTTPTTPTNPEIPKTGDNSNMFLWGAMLFASFFGIVVVLALKKKSVFSR